MKIALLHGHYNEQHLEEAIAAMKAARCNYYGVRTSAPVEVGQYLEYSHDWDYENDCESDEYLPGVCSTGIDFMDYDDIDECVEILKKSIEINNRYGCGMQYIIGGDSIEYGVDDREYIIADARVIAILREA